MMSLRRVCIAAVGGMLALGPIACERESGSPSHDRGTPNAVYPVRGRVEMIPIAGQPQSEFVVHHEEVPSFLGFDGRVGMPSMVMPLPVGRDVSLGDIRVGDIISFDLAVWSEPGHRGYEARNIVKLPADTRLGFDMTPAPHP